MRAAIFPIAGHNEFPDAGVIPFRLRNSIVIETVADDMRWYWRDRFPKSEIIYVVVYFSRHGRATTIGATDIYLDAFEMAGRIYTGQENVIDRTNDGWPRPWSDQVAKTATRSADCKTKLFGPTTGELELIEALR